MSKIFLLSDTHFNHDKIATYCQRPDNFTELIIKQWKRLVHPKDTVIHLGDVAIGNRKKVADILAELPGTKILVRGNHDQAHGNRWWMDHGFTFSCDGLQLRDCWLTHIPANELPKGCVFNIHGHLHNIWHGFHPDTHKVQKSLDKPWQRLFAVEYTNYAPVEFEKFLSHPKKYLSCGI